MAYGAIEFETFTGGPLPIKRLVQIWASLPEGERLSFCHSLDEQVADQLMAATVVAPIGASRDTQLRAALTSVSGAVAPENMPAG
jgi:hypothetical protein